MAANPETLVLYRTRPHDSRTYLPTYYGRVRYSCLKEAAGGEAFMQIQWCWGLSKGLREQVRTQEKSERRIDFFVVCIREERQLEPRLERDRLFGARRAHNASGWRGAPSERGWKVNFMRRLRRERVENGVGSGQA